MTRSDPVTVPTTRPSSTANLKHPQEGPILNSTVNPVVWGSACGRSRAPASINVGIGRPSAGDG